MTRCRGERFVVLVGHPTYRPRFGFTQADGHCISVAIDCPPEVVMALSLNGDPLPAGVVHAPVLPNAKTVPASPQDLLVQVEVLPGGQHLRAGEAKGEEPLVAGDDDVRPTRHRALQHRLVVRVGDL
ncbi:MAG: hypothetical protein LBE08_13335, partial [Bifidobacteriaceae bacterium]|nr:hypothetical protein [Bifidobacteriaceae bacterium]